MSNWRDILPALAEDGGPSILVTVGAVKGSTPRETGASMLVTMDKIVGSIGGGRLEHRAVAAAHEMLSGGTIEKAARLTVPLGPELAQCCGGHAEILFSRLSDEDIKIFNRLNLNKEKYVLISHWEPGDCRHQIVGEKDLAALPGGPLREAIARRLAEPGAETIGAASADSFTLVQSLSDDEFRLCLFGAGHVGRAVAQAFAPLPCRLYWIDSRPDEFPDLLPANAVKMVTADPLTMLDDMPACDFYLVMTHSHQLDLDICAGLLRRVSPDAYIGLIGSRTKKAKFDRRLARQGFDAATIAHITSPIGMAELYGKRPAEIAVGVAADLLIRWKAKQNAVPEVKSEGANAR